MSDDINYPPLEEGMDLTPVPGIVKPANYDLAHAAYYAHIFGPNKQMLGSGIVDGNNIVDFQPGSSKEFSGMRVKIRYGESAAPEPEPNPDPTVDINLYPGWATSVPHTEVWSFNSVADMVFSLDGTTIVLWTLQYDGDDNEIPGSETVFTWGDGVDFPSKQYEISATIVDRWISDNQLNYPRLSIAEDTFLPLTEGFVVGIREQGFVDSTAGFIVVRLTIRQTDDLNKVATGLFRVNKSGIDSGGGTGPMVLTIDAGLIAESGQEV